MAWIEWTDMVNVGTRGVRKKYDLIETYWDAKTIHIFISKKIGILVFFHSSWLCYKLNAELSSRDYQSDNQFLATLGMVEPCWLNHSFPENLLTSSNHFPGEDEDVGGDGMVGMISGSATAACNIHSKRFVQS